MEKEERSPRKEAEDEGGRNQEAQGAEQGGAEVQEGTQRQGKRGEAGLWQIQSERAHEAQGGEGEEEGGREEEGRRGKKDAQVPQIQVIIATRRC